MNVAELIERLNAMPQDLEVLTEGEENGSYCLQNIMNVSYQQETYLEEGPFVILESN